MAIFYMRTSIVKASKGKCAVASAAYQCAQKLYDERIGKTFCYTTKEEVVHSEVILPQNAPDKYADRSVLWNAVEAAQNKANSRYARQFVIAVPNEWAREEAIERSRDYIKKAFVDRGMAADWSYHEKNSDDPNKPDNHHLHIMTTVRGFNEDGSWAAMEKKTFALDKDGNRIPEIDPKTGEQKVRIRSRNGIKSTEKLWKRITVQANNWNSKQQLRVWKKEWADHCNQYLKPEQQIDPRSYIERGIDKLPMLHEGPAAREMERRGAISDIATENRERRKINAFFERAEKFIESARKQLTDTWSLLTERWEYGYRSSKRQTRSTAADDGSDQGLPGSRRRPDRRDPSLGCTASAHKTADPGYREKDLISHAFDLSSRAGSLLSMATSFSELSDTEEEYRKRRIRH